jgi:LacI family transcriptional regulator
MAVEHLIDHGYENIVCIAANSHLLTIKERIAGYKESIRRAKLPVIKDLNLSTPSSARSVLSQLFASRSRPDAIFTANNASTIWIIAALREMGVQMGQDLGVAGFDDVDFFTLITPSVTAVRQPASELGNVSTRLLLQRIHGEFQTPSVRTVLPVTLTIRESCGCKRGDNAF